MLLYAPAAGCNQSRTPRGNVGHTSILGLDYCRTVESRIRPISPRRGKDATELHSSVNISYFEFRWQACTDDVLSLHSATKVFQAPGTHDYHSHWLRRNVGAVSRYRKGCGHQATSSNRQNEGGNGKPYQPSVLQAFRCFVPPRVISR